MMAAAYPTPWSVVVLPYVAGPPDSHGNVTEGWADPITCSVYGWAPPAPSDEPEESGRAAVVSEVQVYAPPHVQVSPRDRVLLLGKTWEVVGYPNDYTHGPFGWQPGIVFVVRLVEG